MVAVALPLGLLLAAGAGLALGRLGPGASKGARGERTPERSSMADVAPILDNHALGLAQIRERRYLWVNARWAEILGLSPGHLTGAALRSLHLDDGTFEAFGQEAYTAIARAGRYAGDVRLRKVDGTPFWGHLCGSLMVTGDPDSGTLWSLEDVTARVEARDEQAEGLALNQKLIASSPTGILLIRSLDGRGMLVNEAASRMLGVSRAELLQTSFRRSASWKSSGMLEAAEAALASPEEQRLEISLSFPGVEQRWMDVQLVSFMSRGERLLLLMMVDVSERIQAGLELQKTERAREALMEELKQKNKELETLVYVASHDLRSPLVNIQGFSQRLGKALDEFKRRLEEAGSLGEVRDALLPMLQDRMPAALGYIRASGAKMDAIINGLLRLSRAGRLVLRTEKLDMDQILMATTASMAFQFQSVEAEIQVTDLPPCLADPVQIAQVFSNLLDNAIKYRAPDRRLRVQVSGGSVGAMVRYTVEDNGIGVPPEQQERIWDIFQRLDPTGPTPGEGLGLTLVRRMVERNGGRIWVESGPGGGCRFQVELHAG